MAQYVTTAFVNEDADFWNVYKAEDRLRLVGTFVVEADSIDAAAEAMWHVGNRMGNDLVGRGWPSTVRSMSIGDVVVIDGASLHAVHVGWEVIPR